MAILKPTVELVRVHPNAILPTRGSAGACGWDVRNVEPFTLEANTPTLVRTGWKVAVPDGYELQVRSRSGLALKRGVTVLNSPGTIDCDYRGELGVILMWDGEPQEKLEHHWEMPFEAGTRIAQVVLQPVTVPSFKEVEEFSSTTDRGEGGFGSTGRV